MKVYRSPMEKILEKQENDTIITNPKEAPLTPPNDGQPLFSRGSCIKKSFVATSGPCTWKKRKPPYAPPGKMRLS
jgi:hypothetical protein